MRNTPQDDIYFNLIQEIEKKILEHIPNSWKKGNYVKFWQLRNEVCNLVAKGFNKLNNINK